MENIGQIDIDSHVLDPLQKLTKNLEFVNQEIARLY
jgi:hypothetical protein